MAKKSVEDTLDGEGASGSGDGQLHITDEVRKSILYVIDEMEKVKLQQGQIKDDVNAIAVKMGCKPTRVKGIISLVIKEREQGGVLTEEEQRLEWTRQVLEKMDLDSSRDSE